MPILPLAIYYLRIVLFDEIDKLEINTYMYLYSYPSSSIVFLYLYTNIHLFFFFFVIKKRCTIEITIQVARK